MADSRGLQVAIAAQQAVHFVGMPEGFYPLAHATLYLAVAPKSRSVGGAYAAALTDVENTRNDPVPPHLRNTPARLAHAAAQLNLPENLLGRRYYEPGDQGAEKRRSE